MKNSPFKFLDAYTIEDKATFFGRDTEINTLYQMLSKSPIVLVYGYSGTGKTSLIKCGLASRYSSADWYPLYIRRNENINHSLLEKLKKATPDLSPTTDLLTRCDELYTNYFRPVFLIFDQLEELFIIGDEDEQHQFVSTIKALLKEDIPIKIILIIREEYLGSFYQIEKEIPYIFDYKLRVEQMNLESIKKVITTSFSAFNISVGDPPEEQIEKIIQKVSQGNSGIKLPYLQVYLDELYEEDFARTYPGKNRVKNEFPPIQLTPAEINAFGAIDDVLEKFLQKQEQLIVKKWSGKHTELTEEHVREIISNFITDEGTKKPIAYEMKDGILTPEESFRQDLPYMEAKELADCLNALEQCRIIRFTKDTIELAHDSLAAIIFRLRDHELLKLKEIKNQLTVLYAAHLDTGSYLTRKKLEYYEDYLPLLSLPPELDDFIAASRREIRKKYIISVLKTIGTVLLGVSLIFVIFFWIKFNEIKNDRLGIIGNLTATIQSLTKGNLFRSEAANVLQQSNNNPTKAVQKAMDLLENAEKENMADSLHTIQALIRQILQQQYLQPPYLKDMVSEKKLLKVGITPYSDSMYHFILLAPEDSILRMERWDRQFSSEEGILFKAASAINDFQIFSYYDQPYLAIATVEGLAQIWSLETGILLSEKKLGSPIQRIAKSSLEGELVISTKKELGRLRLKKEKLFYHKVWSFRAPIKDFAVHPKNNVIAVLTTNAQNVILLNKFNLRQAKIGRNHCSVTAMAFSHDGQYLITCYDNGNMGIWDLTERKEIQTITTGAIIQTVAVSPDDHLLLTGDLQNNVLLWAKDGTVFKEMIGHQAPIQQVGFMDEEHIFSTTDKNIKLWNIGSFAERRFEMGSPVRQVAISPDGTQILACDDQLRGAFHLLDNTNGNRQIIRQQIHPGKRTSKINALTFLNEHQILSGGDNHLVSTLDWQDDSTQIDFRPFTKKIRTSRISCLAAHENLIAIGQTRKVILRKKDAPDDWYQMLPYDAPVRCLAFAESGVWLFVGYTNGTIVQWDVRTGRAVDTLSEHYGPVNTIRAFAMEGQHYLLSGGTDNQAIVWREEEPGSYSVFQPLNGHLGDVLTVDFAPTPSLALTGSEDKTIKLWHWTGHQFEERITPIRHLKKINTAVFSPDGRQIITGGDDHMVKVWRVD